MNLQPKETEESVIDYIKVHDLYCLEYVSLDHMFSDGTYLIHKACFYNFLDLVVLIVSAKGIEVLKLKGGRKNSTPLVFSIYNNSNDVLLMIIDVLTDEGKKILDLNTEKDLLHLCIKYDNTIAYIIFIAYGFNWKNRIRKGYNSYEYAKKHNKYRFISFHKQNLKETPDNNNYLHRSKTYDLHKKLNASNIRFFRVLMFFTLILTPFALVKCDWVLILIFPIIPIQNRIFVNSKFYLLINIILKIFYIYNLCYNISTFKTIITTINLLSFLCLILIRPKSVPNNNINHVKEIVRKLSMQFKLDLNYFCYKCLVEKGENIIHCHICNLCIYDFDHHCKFLNNCVSSSNSLYFDTYLFTNLILLAYLPDLVFKPLVRIFFSMILFFILLQTIGRVSIIIESLRKKCEDWRFRLTKPRNK